MAKKQSKQFNQLCVMEGTLMPEGGVEELDINRLSDLIILKYKALLDGEKNLGNPEGIKNMFIDFQKHLY